MITNRMIVSILGAFAFVVLATLLGHFLLVAHTQSGIAQTQAEEESFFAALRRETNATFFVPEHDVFGVANGYAASGTPCTLPYLGNCGDLSRVAVKPVPGQPVPFELPSYTNAPHEVDSEQSQINGNVIWTAYYFDAKNQRIVEYHYANRSASDAVTGLSAPVTTWPHIAWMGAGMLLASTGAVGYASPSPVYADIVQQDAALSSESGTAPLPIYGTPSCPNPPGQVELYMQAFLSQGFQAQYPGTAALAHPACFPFDVITKMGGPPDDLAGNLNLFLEVQGVPADDSAPLPYTAGPITSDHYFVPLHRAALIGGMRPPMPRVVDVYYGVHSSVMPTSATAMQVWAQSQTDTSGTWSYTAAQPTPNPAQVAAINAMPGDTSLGDLSIGEAWAQGYHWLVSLPSCSVLSGGSWSANVAPVQAYRSNQVGPSSLFAADGSGIGYSIGYVALPQPPSPPASTVTCNGTVQLIMPAGGWPGGAVAPTAKFSVVYAAGLAFKTWPAVLQVGANGTPLGQSGSTMVAMVQRPQGLLASLTARVSPWINTALGGGVAVAGGGGIGCHWVIIDPSYGGGAQQMELICPSPAPGATAPPPPPPPAIIPGNCYAKALTASGTPDLTIAGMPAAEQTALDSALGIGGFGVDNTGCIDELNLAANAWEPAPNFGGIVYEPSGTAKTFGIKTNSCMTAGDASTGAWNPGYSNEVQALLGITGGSTGGTCAINLTDGTTTQYVADAGQVQVQTLSCAPDAAGYCETTTISGGYYYQPIYSPLPPWQGPSSSQVGHDLNIAARTTVNMYQNGALVGTYTEFPEFCHPYPSGSRTPSGCTGMFPTWLPSAPPPMP